MIVNQELDVEFNRSKIYEKLAYQPEPKGYNKKISWIVQNQVAATNGKHYIDRIGKLDEIPVFSIPTPRPSPGSLMLDIGSGWGRWLVAGANKGYIPVGIDLRLEFAETQQEVLKSNNQKGYSVVADLGNMPFREGVFDLVWSFSVIQHVHKVRLMNCLSEISKVLKRSGKILLEFPNRNGIRNRMNKFLLNDPALNDYNDWGVRYYTPSEYKNMIEPLFSNYSIRNHSVLGIGVLKEDLKYVSFKNKIFCAISLGLSGLTKLIPGLTKIADSIYISASKAETIASDLDVSSFLKEHHEKSFDNLNVVQLLKCPQHGTPVTLSSDRKRVISQVAGIYYPVINNIPIMIASEALPL